MNKLQVRNAFIIAFTILFNLAFHYESIRYFYLNPLFEKPLPKIKFLFPPAGWIMFFNVDNSYGTREIYGIKGDSIQKIDPHDIIRTRTIGYDNIHRGILSGAASPRNAGRFCRFLRHRLPEFDNFVVKLIYYPDITGKPYERLERIEYQCFEGKRP